MKRHSVDTFVSIMRQLSTRQSTNVDCYSQAICEDSGVGRDELLLVRQRFRIPPQTSPNHFRARGPAAAGPYLGADLFLWSDGLEIAFDVEPVAEGNGFVFNHLFRHGREISMQILDRNLTR